MKIAWLSQYRLNKDNSTDSDAIIGGAEITIDKHMAKGKELGHDIELITPKLMNDDTKGEDNPDKPKAKVVYEKFGKQSPRDYALKKIDEADLLVLSNVQWGLHVKEFRHSDLDDFIERKKFIILSHDATYCQYRNPDCVDEPRVKSNHCPINSCRGTVKLHWWRKAYDKSLLTVFLSPLQLRDARKFYWKELTDDKVACVPPPVHKADMMPSEEARKKGTYCVVGNIYPGKGFEDILDNYSSLGKNLRFIGKVTHQGLANLIKNAGCTIVPPVPYSEMPKVLQKYEYMIVSRRVGVVSPEGKYLVDDKQNRLYTYMKEGFSRIIPEALINGIKILVDNESRKRIGAYSYGWSNEEIIERCNVADATFWEVLKNKQIIK